MEKDLNLIHENEKLKKRISELENRLTNVNKKQKKS